MIILDGTAKSLEIKLSGAPATNQLPYVLAYVERLKSDQSVTALAPTDGVTNSGTAVTVCAAPADANHTRQITDLSVQNADTAAVTLTIQYNDNGTVRVIGKFTIDPGDHVIYAD